MDFIIRRKTLISMLFVAMTMMGVLSYHRLEMELYPTPELPYLVVMVNSQTELDPSYIEKQAIIPIEGAIGQLEGIEEITSYVSSRSSTIQITYNDKTNLKFAYLRLQEKMQKTQQELNNEFRINVNRVNTESISNQFMNLQMLGEGGVDRLRNFAEEEIIDKIKNIDGIASVNIYGGHSKSVEIFLDPDIAEAYNLTPARLRQLLSSGQNDRTYLGEVYQSNQRYFVNLTAEFSSIADLEQIIVDPSGPILLKDIAEITFGTKEETSYSRVNGKDVITLMLINDDSKNLIELSHNTREIIEELNSKYAKANIELLIQNDSSEIMEDNINQIINLALLGGILAIIVLWYFLRNLRLVIAVALAIPISVYTAFNFFYAYNISINTLTLVGIALAIGMLIDNSVVVLENIYRLAATGMKNKKAVLQGTKEVIRSIVAATFTTICVFLPFLFSSDIVTKLLGKQIGVSIVATLLISLLAALLFIPMVTHHFISRKKKKENNLNFENISTRNRLVQVYLLLLKASMRKPVVTVLLALTVFFVTLAISIGRSTNNLSEVVTNTLSVYVTMPTGSSLETTDKLVRSLEQDLLNIEELNQLTTQVEEETGILKMLLVEDYEKVNNHELSQIKSQVKNYMNRYERRADLDFQQSSSNSRFARGGGGGNNAAGRMERMLGMGTKEERIIIRGEDFELMNQVAEDIKNYLEDELDEVSRAHTNTSGSTPEVHLNFDAEIMGRKNIPLSSVTSELASFSNQVESGFTFKQGNEEYEIVIKMDTSELVKANTLNDLEKLQIKSSNNASYELQHISKIYYSSGLTRINRVNQSKEIEVTYSFKSEYNESKDLQKQARDAVDDLVANLNIPTGIAIEVIHEEDDYAELKKLIGIAFILIFMILASVFESFSTPFVLMFSIPMAAIGSLLGLILTGNSLLNANTLIGFLILLGVVVNNGIILIDYSNILKKRGYRQSRALMMAGLARLRPIMITAITTIVAMLPLALGNSEYVGVIGAPFAITVIGGLAVSTLLTLVFLPTVYSGLNNALEWFQSLQLELKVLQVIIYLVAGYLIITKVEEFVWILIDIIAVVMLVPAIIWFILNSLRKANETTIPLEESIIIKIQNLVKIYDRESRFTREWNAGTKIRERFGEGKTYQNWKDLDEFTWLLPVTTGLGWFTLVYLDKALWQFLFLIALYFLVKHIFAILFKLETSKLKEKSASFGYKIAKTLNWVAHWLLPSTAIAYLYHEHKNIGGSIVLLILWYLALAIDKTSRKIYTENINIQRLTGKRKKLRKAIYSFVLSIPIIGKKKKPFKALKGVSLEIGNGMYGLLGPNGAGKSTLMRAICGINQQSYGKIWFNEIDTELKREELQGLIGYLPQEFGMYENMSSWDYLNYQAILKKITNKKVREERVQHVLESVHMWEDRNKKIGSFSGGMKQRIGIAQVLLHLPRVLVVDEPTAGLDPRERIRFRNLLVELSRKRIVIFSTHIIEDIASSCDHLAVLKKGAVQYVGSPRKMTETALGHIWMITIPANQFEEYSNKLYVIHHLREGDNIRMRIIAENKPAEDAVEVKPNLEDAYLWLQKTN